MPVSVSNTRVEKNTVQSNALWPKGVCSSMYGDNISTDTHRTFEAARGVLDGLMKRGFGGMGKDFPLAGWISPIQDPPQLPEAYRKMKDKNG